MPTITEELDRIIDHVGRYGVRASEPQLHRLATLAAAHDVQPAIRSLVTDASTPDVVRSRAVARVVAGLRSTPVGRVPGIAA